MKVKTSGLIGHALDWAVATCEGYTDYCHETEKMMPPRKGYGWVNLCDLNYSTDWAQGGPIIEREQIRLDPRESEWEAQYWDNGLENYADYFGPTPLIAAMRCYVASKLGDVVEVPDELF